MAIPFIIAGVAAVAGAYGAKKGYDAYKDNGEANEVNEKAKLLFDDAQRDLNSSRTKTNQQLEELGRSKLSLFEDIFPRFITTFQKIKNINMTSDIADLETMQETEGIVLELKNESIKLTELAGGTIASLGSGALAGFGAFGGAGMLATASTGTAISSLSGVAATNATLAWFGGGSLAAGGLGMAGGTAILGGIVAGPVLAVAGGLMAAKAEKAKYSAYENLEKAKAEVNKLDTARVIVEGIYQRAKEMNDVLFKLTSLFKEGFIMMEYIVSKNSNYVTYDQSDREIISKVSGIVKTLANLSNVPLLDKDGVLTEKSREVLEQAVALVENLETI